MRERYFETRQKIVVAVKRKITSEWHAEHHPEDPHADDEANYCDDLIDQAVEDHASAMGMAYPTVDA